MRGDLLESLVLPSPLQYPNFTRLLDEGAATFNARSDFSLTTSVPNHTSILTGRPIFQPIGAPNTTHHGYTNNGTPGPNDTLQNSGNPNLSYIPSVFDVVHDSGLSTLLSATKGFIVHSRSYDEVNGAIDTNGTDNGRDKIDSFVFTPPDGRPKNSAPRHADFLADMAVNEFNYTYLHYRDLDTAGHEFGWESAAWVTALGQVDGYLGDLFALIESTPGLADDTAVIVTADHGGTGLEHFTAANPANYTVPVFIWGPSVTPGADLYDLNLTNRLEPGTSRPDYTAPTQPIRNSDTANLALELLGLSAIPGSSINADQDLVITSALTADFDEDQEVDGQDLARWASGFGMQSGVPKSEGNADVDEDIDGGDFLIWQRDFGSSVETLEIAADFDGDDAVDTQDLASWVSGFSIKSEALHSEGDTNFDGDVDGGDFLKWQRDFGFSLETLTFASDFDGDQVVGEQDLALWANGFTTNLGSIESRGDADSDGDVDGSDFLEWQREFGSSFVTQQSILAVVPEPSGLALLFVSALSICNGKGILYLTRRESP